MKKNTDKVRKLSKSGKSVTRVVGGGKSSKTKLVLRSDKHTHSKQAVSDVSAFSMVPAKQETTAPPKMLAHIPAQHHKQSSIEALPKPKVIDLFPWPFEKTRKGVILRDDWNGLVRKIQATGAKELEVENADLHNKLAKLLNENEAMKTKYQKMAAFVAKFNRDFTAEFN
jgi:hypothetical protein